MENQKSQSTGLNSYKKYWEEQARFISNSIWDKDKIIKLTILNEFENNFKDLKFSNHSLKKEDGQLILRLKVPSKYHDFDSFKSKALELLGIDKDWLTDFTLSNSHCTHHSLRMAHKKYP